MSPIAAGDLPAGAELGSANDDMRSLQADLNALGANPRLDEDGIAGPVTLAAIKLRIDAKR